MRKLLQINVTANSGSTGRIAEQIGQAAISHGWESYIAYGRSKGKSQSNLIKIGNKLGIYYHVLITRLFDRHGLGSRFATQRLIKKIKKIQPDIIHLHNIHGYYINYKILFEYLAESKTPVVWTLHDCWSFTGHCAHYVDVNCEQWKSECIGCSCHSLYPRSLTSRINRNYKLKKNLFLSLKDKLTLVPVSKWLAGQTSKSFFSDSRIQYIYNGVDTSVFVPNQMNEIRKKYGAEDKFVIISVAFPWSEIKGFSDLIKLRAKLPDDYIIILVGLADEKIKSLPKGIIGVKRTHSQKELADLYAMSDVLLSLSRAETFGLTIAEGMACGTPAIVYNRTATPELITKETGLVVDQVGDIDGVIAAVKEIKSNGKARYSEFCRKRAEEFFDKDKCFQKYIDLYNEILENK